MRHNKALILSVTVTLLVSIGVIVFNNTYASTDPPATPAAREDTSGVDDPFNRLKVDTAPGSTGEGERSSASASDDDDDDAWSDDHGDDDEEDHEDDGENDDDDDD